MIQHFLKDIEDGTYDGFPQAGIGLAALQNPAYRRYLKIPDDDHGVRIDRIYPIPTTQKVLRPDDVLLRVGTYDVGSDGTIIYQNNRVHLAFGFSEAQHGQEVPLRIWRDGKALDLSLPIFVNTIDRAEGSQYDIQPRYVVYGGLVFTPLTRDYLRTFGANWTDAASSELVYELYYRRVESPETARSEPIVLAQTLAHPVNADLEMRGRSLVDKINGIRIERLEDVVRAFEQEGKAFDAIEFLPYHNLECLDRAEVKKAHEEILKTYGVPKDRRL